MPKKVFQIAAEVGAALIVQVKDNQPTLHQQVEQIASTTAPIAAAHSHNTGRNRDERRTVSVFDPADQFVGSDWHPHVAAVICVEREMFTRSSKTGLLHHTTETAFYVSNAQVAAARTAEAIRAHWGIENTPTTAATSPSPKTARAFAQTPVCSPAFAASASTSSRQIAPTR